MCAFPAAVNAQQPAQLFIGFKEDANGDTDPIEIVVRTTVVNGEPENAEDLIFTLDSDHAAQALTIVPQPYTEMRVKMEVYQLGEMGDISDAGGMYVDLPINAGHEPAQLVAYGADIQLLV